VATLGGVLDVGLTGNATVSSAIEIAPTKRASRLTPDGLHAAFLSADPVLAEEVANYDNLDANSGKPDRELYLYDATANGGEGELVCASCNPSGARPAGRVTEVKDNIFSAARIPGWITALHPGSLFSADGHRLFFESFEPLVPRDTNGRGDVYEWEAAKDKAECTKEIGGELFSADSGGCLSLISSGEGAADSELIDASTDGQDVFFTTNSRLVGQDTDEFVDVYDAREGGGFPPPPVPPPPCEGDACQNPPAPPAAVTPASEGSGPSTNLPPPAKARQCPKGKHRVTRKGKAHCVANRKARKRGRARR